MTLFASAKITTIPVVVLISCNVLVDSSAFSIKTLSILIETVALYKIIASAAVAGLATQANHLRSFRTNVRSPHSFVGSLLLPVAVLCVLLVRCVCLVCFGA